jgi:hypothetical protein
MYIRDGYIHQAVDVPNSAGCKRYFFMTLFQNINSAIFAAPKMTYA